MTKPASELAQCSARLAAVADTAYATIAETFPVCSASDEFYFFPQVHRETFAWSSWDDFSPQKLEACLAKLHACETDLADLASHALSADDRIDLGLLTQTLRTLREQLLDVAPHRNQPTFHLSIIACGLAEALARPDPMAWPQRVSGLQDFVVRAGGCLEKVPEMFLAMGHAMLADLRSWLSGLGEKNFDTTGVAAALDRFQDILNNVTTCTEVLLEEQTLAALVADHLGCGLDVDTAMRVLDEEYREMETVLEREASRLIGRTDWRKALAQIPFCAAPDQDLLALYRSELQRLERHCRAFGLLPESLPETGRLEVLPVPAYLQAVRASDAYAARPGFPPRGGTFYVLQEGYEQHGVVGRSLEYRVTAIHEAWPGHHLLDYARWSSPHVLRRPIEQPLFYEGWACLAEELMIRTGYLEGPWDRFLLAKRRLERAARGIVDLGLQSGRMTIGQAVETLNQAGYDQRVAQRTVPKYLLRPGYQVCYTLGLKPALALLDQYGRDDLGRFVRTVLAEAEIGFPRLAEVFENAGV